MSIVDVASRTSKKTKVIEIKTSNEETYYLSNFYPSKIVFEDVEFSTVEHCYQWCKFRYGTEDELVDEELDRNVHAEKIRQAPTAKHAYQLGNGKYCQINPNWEEMKVDLMRELLLIKFDTYPELAGKLIATKNAAIVEKSYSPFWACGSDNKGQNMLGILLMELRDHYIELLNKGKRTNGPSAANPLSQDK